MAWILQPTISDILSTLGVYLLNSPLSSLACFFVTICCLNRLVTGVQFAQHQRSEKIERKAPVIPYWIPGLGHFLSVVIDFPSLLTRARNTAKDGVFIVKVPGWSYYMVIQPSLVKQIFVQRLSSVSHEGFLLWTLDKVLGDRGMTSKVQDHADSAHKLLSMMLREPFLSESTKSLAQSLEERLPTMFDLDISSLSDKHWYNIAKVSRSDGGILEANMCALITHFIGDLSCRMLLGSGFVQKYPTAVADVFILDEAFALLMTGFPTITPTIARAKAARQRLHAAVQDWRNALTTEEKKPDAEFGSMSDVPTIMRERVGVWQNHNVPASVSNASDMGFLWVMNTNSNKIVYWLLVHAYSDDQLLSDLRKEVEEYVKVPNGNSSKLILDTNGILNSCPLLRSTWYETMRVDVYGAEFKSVIQDIMLVESVEDASKWGSPHPRSYQIPAGSVVAVPNGTMQMDPRLFVEPRKFQATRFLEKDLDSGKSKATLGLLNSFGGGPNMCKGRAFAEREVLIFAATMLTCWDVRPVGEAKWDIQTDDFTGAPIRMKELRVEFSSRLFADHKN